MSYADVNPLGVESLNISGENSAPIHSLQQSNVEARIITTYLGHQNPEETLLSYDPVDSNPNEKDKGDLGEEDLDKDDLKEQAANESQDNIENPDELEVQNASDDSKK